MFAISRTNFLHELESAPQTLFINLHGNVLILLVSHVSYPACSGFSEIPHPIEIIFKSLLKCTCKICCQDCLATSTYVK